MNLKDWISLHIPTPKYMSMSHVGIDISPTSIHMAEVKRRGTHLELGKYGVVELGNQINFNDPLTANEELLSSLKKMQKQYHLQFVEVSIPEEQAYIFTSDLPEGDETTIRNHIELHLEENVPISLADAVFDYHVIAKPFETKDGVDRIVIDEIKKVEPIANNSLTNSNTGDAPAQTESSTLQVEGPIVVRLPSDLPATQSESQTSTQSGGQVSNQPQSSAQVSSPAQAPTATPENIETNTPVSLPQSVSIQTAGPTFLASISVVPKALIDQYIELFEMAGMVPVSFLVENQAVSKAVIKKGDLSTKLIVHVSNKKTVLSVVSKGSVHFTSTINIGSEDFTAAIMKEFNVSREEAIRMKTEKGFLKNADGTDKSQTTIFLSLINTASALKDEIDRIVLYWQSYVSKHSSNNDGSIDSILLSGRDALINGFKEYLRATVRLQVDTANVWSNVYDLDVKIPNIDYIDSLDYAVAIGLGLPRIGGKSH